MIVTVLRKRLFPPYVFYIQLHAGTPFSLLVCCSNADFEMRSSRAWKCCYYSF